MQKFAVAQILDARIALAGNPLMRTAHRHAFDYTPKHGMLYVRSRMISSRCNDNFDEFDGGEIKKAYRTFIGKPVFVNHNNENHRRARGVIIDAALHEDRNPDGTPDIWVEGLMEVDALRFPKLAQAVVAGDVDRTSMGVDVAFSICAVCNNKATTPLEYCAHIPGQKGRKHVRIEASTGARKETLIREKCFGLRFFENSLLVEEPADPTAYTLGKVELGPGLEHLGMARTASRQSIGGMTVVTDPNVPRGTAYVFPSAMAPTASLAKFAHGGTCPACRGTDTISVQGSAECFDCQYLYRLGSTAPADFRPSTLREAKYPFVIKDHPDPGSHPIWKDLGVNVDHIVHHYDQATAGEKADGMRWYPDAQLLAHHVGNSTGQGIHKAAGLMSAYSPQMEWHANMHHAVRSLHEGRAIGPGEGATVMASHQKAAQAILDGADHQKVLKGPKTNAFAHTIEHGGMDPETGKPSRRVTVDTHAVSVMCGRRLTNDEKADAASAIGKPHFYQHAEKLYQQAADHVSKRDGIEIAPHQMQAVTWGVRKRINDEDPEFKNKGSQTLERKNTENWQAYHPGTPGSEFAENSAQPGARNLHANRGRRGRH